MEDGRKANIARMAAAFSLFWALLPNPYVYYIFLRWLISPVAAVTAYQLFKSQAAGPAWLFVGFAVLFNPILPFYMARSTWSIVDIGGALALLWATGSLRHTTRKAETAGPATEGFQREDEPS